LTVKSLEEKIIRNSTSAQILRYSYFLEKISERLETDQTFSRAFEYCFDISTVILEGTI